MRKVLSLVVCLTTSSIALAQDLVPGDQTGNGGTARERLNVGILDEVEEKRLAAEAAQAFEKAKLETAPQAFDPTDPFKNEEERLVDPKSIDMRNFASESESDNSRAAKLRRLRHCENQEINDAGLGRRSADIEAACSQELNDLKQGLPQTVLEQGSDFQQEIRRQRENLLAEAERIRARDRQLEASKIVTPRSYQRELARLNFLDQCQELRENGKSGDSIGCPEDLKALELTEAERIGLSEYLQFYTRRAQESAQ